MVTPIQQKALIRSALVIALSLKATSLMTLPALAKNAEDANLQFNDLTPFGSASTVHNTGSGKCTFLDSQAPQPTKIASTTPGFMVAQSAPTAGGGSCPADFTAIPCGTGSELFCEVGGVTDGSVGGGVLAPLAPLAALGGGFPVAALAPLAGIPFAFIGGGNDNGGNTTPPSTPPTSDTPIPEPSMIPAVGIALGFIYWNRRRRQIKTSSVDLAPKD